MALPLFIHWLLVQWKYQAVSSEHDYTFGYVYSGKIIDKYELQPRNRGDFRANRYLK